MPRPKDVKEQVVYPASKRKVSAFKPQRPSQAPRTSTEESGRSNEVPERTHSAATAGPSRVPSLSKGLPSVARVEADSIDLCLANGDELVDSSDELPENPLAAVTRKPATKAPSRQASTTTKTSNTAPAALGEALAPDIDPDANIPQALLLRLMHEHFQDKDTKIDKVAIGTLQKYVDLFVRETMARAALNKKEEVDLGKASQSDVRWLERDDLEKVAGGMLMDF